MRIDKYKSGMIPIITIILVLACIFLIIVGVAIGASFYGSAQWAEPAKANTGSSSSCSAWSNSPGKYQEIFTSAAEEYGIKSSLLGAIFLSENGNSWAKAATLVGDPAKSWASSSKGAKGPFQFMDGTWDSNQVDGGKAIDNGKDWQKNKDGDKNVLDVVDASFGAARLIQANISNFAGKRFMTEEEKDIKLIGACYNWGCGGDHLDNIKKEIEGKDSETPIETVNYMTNIWKNFRNLNVGCYDPNQTVFGGGKLLGYDPKFNQSLRSQEPVKYWPDAVKVYGGMASSPRVDGTIPMTGVVLHWTGGSNVAGALSGMTGTYEMSGGKMKITSDRGYFVQLIIDKDGTVYQLLPLNAKVYGSSEGNSFAIGIEIVGTGESDLMNNQVQKKAVKDTVQYLITNYNVPNLKGTELNLAAKKGIFGHYQVTDPGRKSDPGANFMRDIWAALGSTNS